MRERSTWNRNVIAKKAAEVAGDIYTMNQDHPQPAADEYVIGDSSDFAEDVHSPNTWEAEYSGDAVKRNEIGLPELRSDTFNHAEKTAAERKIRLKKAELCVAVAKLMMRGKRVASETIEDQAVALMYMPDHELIDTHKRLAQEQQSQGDEFEEDVDDDDSDDDDSDDEGQTKQAGQVPPQFKENIEKMKAKSKDSDDDDSDEDEGQSKQANQDEDDSDDDDADGQTKQAGQDDDEVPEFIQKKIDESKDQGEKKQAKLVKKIKLAMGQQQELLAQMQQLLQQAQQQQEPIVQQAPAAPAQAQDDLDQLLANSDLGPTAEADIELDAPVMDDTDLGGEDEILRTLFAQDESEEEDEKAPQQQQSKQAAVRTASTRTVGTRPTAGVSKLGGSVSKTASASQVDNLSALWSSAPDVRAAFGLK